MIKNLTNMNNLEFTQAFIDANEAVLNKVTALEETRALRRLIKACEQRIDERSDEAVQQATEILAAENKSQGEFVYNNHKYQIEVKPDYSEFINEPQKYTQEECVDYRYQNKVRERNRIAAKACTVNMAADVKTYRINHPDWEPANNTVTLKVID